MNKSTSVFSQLIIDPFFKLCIQFGSSPKNDATVVMIIMIFI